MGGPVEITNREMYDAIQAANRQLVVMAEKIDRLCEAVGDHEGRIRGLESRRWPLPLLSAVLGLCAIALSTWVALGGGG